MPPIGPTTLVIITGLPCSGKSTLAALIEAQLRTPVISKDHLKEQLFQSLGWSDREWSRKLSAASYLIMFALARKLLEVGCSCVLEGNFRSYQQAAFEQLIAGLKVRCIQVVCHAPAAILVERFLGRAHSGVRHPGHVDLESFRELEIELRSGRCEPLRLPGIVLEYESTGAGAKPSADLIAKLQRLGSVAADEES